MHYSVSKQRNSIDQIEMDIEQVKGLWKSCFHDTQEYMDFYFHWKTRDNVIYGSYQNEQLVAMLHLNPYKLHVENSEIESFYIVGVATDENHRKKGLMRRLLSESMKQMYEEKIPFAYLMPASEAIYLPFDFRIVTQQKRMSIPFAELINNGNESIVEAASIQRKYKAKFHEDDQRIRIQGITEENEVLLDRIAKYADQHLLRSEDVFTLRDVYYYKRMIAELKACNGELLVATDHDEIVGYGAYVLEEGRLEIIELLTNRMYHEEIIDMLCEKVKERLEREKIEVISGILPSRAPTIMARIIHFKQFLLLLRGEKTVQLVIKVEDKFIEENRGIYEMICSENECKVTKLDEVEYNEVSIDIDGDIAQLTKLFFGKIPVDERDAIISGDYKTINSRLEALHMLESIHINEIV